MTPEQQARRNPGGRPSLRARLTLGLLATATLVVMTTETLPVGLLTQMADGLGVSEGRLGLLVTAYGAVVVVGAIPLSILAARFPPRASIVAVLALFVVSLALLAIADDLPAAMAGRLIGGAAHAVFYSCTFTIAVSVVEESWRGRAVAIVGSGNAFALALGVPAATALGVWLGWRVPFWLSAVLVVAILLALVVTYRPLAATREPAPRARALLSGIISWPLARVALTIVLVMSAHFLTYTYISPILTGAGLPEQFVSVALVGFGVGSVIGLGIVGRFSDTRPASLLKLTVGLTLVAIATLGLLRGSATGAVGATALWGLAFGAAPVLWQLMAVRAAPAAASIGLAVVNAAFNVGISLGALAGGALLSVAAPADVTLPSMLIGAIALVLILQRRWLPRDDLAEGSAELPAA
jgi:predicted MFS family arabinose efflux permease